jgi:hypothetical protein
MVATDTVVGIVGAVVLVAVMAGVFVYEYNNTDAGAMSIEEQQEHFEEDYPGLVALQDIDGDGEPNFNDTDLDGDGVDNPEDTQITQTVPVDANVAAPGPTGATPYEQPFTVSNGTEHFQGTLTYTRAAGGVTPNVQATLSGPSGFSPVTASSTNSGNTYTLTFDIEEPLPPGEYLLTLTQQSAGGVLPIGQAATVQGTLEVHYATPEGEMHTHAPEK